MTRNELEQRLKEIKKKVYDTKIELLVLAEQVMEEKIIGGLTNESVVVDALQDAVEAMRGVVIPVDLEKDL